MNTENEQLELAIDEPKVETQESKMSDEEIHASGMKYIQAQTKALQGGVRLQTRNLLTMLTKHGVDKNLQRQIRETIERAIIAAFDYGVDIDGNPAPIRENGRLGKFEIEYAGTMSKLKEMGMLLMAKKMEKSNFNYDDYTKGASPEVVVEAQTISAEIENAIEN